MFTGIVEQLGTVVSFRDEGSNRTFWVRAAMAPELKVDQSVAHNGVCLTVVAVDKGLFAVTAVKETLERTALGDLLPGGTINLERCLRVGDRLDGHLVQGHVDTTTLCEAVVDQQGSWTYSFQLPSQAHLLVYKGSICINGVSLTVAALHARSFEVAIIPYTHAHTTFRTLRAGQRVNLEFDVLGKYVERLLQHSSVR